MKQTDEENISEGETKYLQQRAPHIDAAVTKLLKDVGLTKPARNPVIGISMSGGGYRAMMYVEIAISANVQ